MSHAFWEGEKTNNTACCICHPCRNDIACWRWDCWCCCCCRRCCCWPYVPDGAVGLLAEVQAGLVAQLLAYLLLCVCRRAAGVYQVEGEELLQPAGNRSSTGHAARQAIRQYRCSATPLHRDNIRSVVQTDSTGPITRWARHCSAAAHTSSAATAHCSSICLYTPPCAALLSHFLFTHVCLQVTSI